MQDPKKRIRSNEKIRAAQIRLIGATGEQMGIVSAEEGLEKARELGLDLVEVSAEANPPVCRILDFGKHLYAISRKEKESRKKQKVIETKVIKMTSKIEEHDYQTKLRNAKRFLERGDKVKLTIFFRGREIIYSALGKRIIAKFTEDVSDIAEIERDDGLEGKMMNVFFMPLKSGSKRSVKTKDSETLNQRV